MVIKVRRTGRAFYGLNTGVAGRRSERTDRLPCLMVLRDKTIYIDRVKNHFISTHRTEANLPFMLSVAGSALLTSHPGRNPSVFVLCSAILGLFNALYLCGTLANHKGIIDDKVEGVTTIFHRFTPT
ncbi:MAG: hypothetical protein A4E65_02549 [Syntrophorhabdus sp. PtaU1.Bin153]|nr:MAG: hypothetical protein A4E65_02549 [Syntrophorhabdus sp. PtaU1.Bin153]